MILIYSCKFLNVVASFLNLALEFSRFNRRLGTNHCYMLGMFKANHIMHFSHKKLSIYQFVSESALTAMSPVFYTLNSGATKYYELAFPIDGVTITLDVIQGGVILYASDNIWNANAQGFDWRVAANTSSGFIEVIFDPSTIGRTARAILFLAIVGGQTTNTYIMNNAVGDIRTRGMMHLPKVY